MARLFPLSRRREATPAAQFFGLPLSAAAGSRVRDFLAALRLRLEVREALDAALGRKTGPSTPLRNRPFDSAQDRPFGSAQDKPFDSAQDRPGRGRRWALLRSFAEHRAAVTAAGELDRRLVPASARREGEFTNVNDLLNRLRSRGTRRSIAGAGGIWASPRTAPPASRLRTFIRGLGARRALQKLHRNILVGEGDTAVPALMTDAELDESLRTHTALLDLILAVHTDPVLAGGSLAKPPPQPSPE